jgi:diguanylate cyclase (GGDEF)-like protein
MVEMVNDDKLSAVLSDFARTMITDFPIQGILDHLIKRIVEILPVSSAGVTLISSELAPRYIAASDAAALRFEKLQTEIREGPCLAAYTSGAAVAVADLRTDVRFPQFAPAAVAAGLAAVFTFPLCHGEGRLGALDLYRDTPGQLDPDDMTAAQTLADVTAAYLMNAQAREEARVTSDLFHHSALHDPLTGLPNRLLIRERLDHAVQRAKRSHTNTAVLFVDLDRFKSVNDTHGHAIGDELLLAVANRLAGLVRSGDTLARFSGDEFVFLCEDLRDAADVELLADRVYKTFDEPFMLTSGEVEISASVGIAFAGPGQAISNELLERADMAMYEVKRQGGAGHQIIDMREGLRTNSDNDMASDLRTAMQHDQIKIAYQPIVRTSDGVVTGVEALLRWTHRDRGVVSPLAILAAAEQSDLINEIGVWVLAQGCRDHAMWEHDYPVETLRLGVNVSARQLVNPHFLANMVSILHEAKMDPGLLELEITESCFMEDSDRTVGMLVDLKSLGVRLALDNFGSSYSGLRYLTRLAIDVIKIDRVLIANICHDPTNRAIVGAVVNLAHNLGLAVVAGGIETQNQRDEAAEVGCDFTQGFFHSRPMGSSAVDELIGAGLGSLPN